MARKQSVSVPPHWIKDAEVDWPGEIFAASGLPLQLSDEVSVPPATFGVWTLLELLDNDFVHPTKAPTDWGACVALAVSVLGRTAAPLVRDAIAAGVHENPPELADLPENIDDLTAAAVRICAAADIKPENALNKLNKLYDHLHLGFSGFNMIPSTGGSGAYLFGLDSFAGIVATTGSMIGATAAQLMWETPLVLLGHLVAAEQKRSGAKGIKRPKDPQDVKLQLALAKDRAKRGVLHPWQEAEPHIYGELGHETEDERYRLAVLFNDRKARLEAEKEAREKALIEANREKTA